MVQYLEKGLLGHIRRAIGAVLRALLIGFIVGVVITEVGGVVFDQGTIAAAWPHNIFFHLAAIVVGLLLAYGLAVTALFRETIGGLIEAARGLEGDVGKLAGLGRQDISHVVDSIEHRQ